MRNISFILLLMMLIGCKQQSKNQQVVNATSQSSLNEIPNDSVALQNLIREVYHWESTHRSQGDFIPAQIAQDESFFHNLDMANHEKKSNEIARSGFFTTDFVNLYDKLGLLIDHYLTERIFIWESGNQPPFSNGANVWCNCQDTPSEDFYKNIVIKNIVITDDVAHFSWSWNANANWDDFSYQVEAQKENGTWKIVSLQGFEELEERLQAMALK
ncbi:hypothetical protein [Capnocytophaga canimorsus]|uniref:hypothetical protein n=1 Tax=Capnocytophaga canimorsus TaxID=28188 RepID=UPI00385ED361